MRLQHILIGLGVMLLCAAAAFFTLPSSWALLNMLFGAQPTTTILPDGTREASTIGPKSPWPEWALKPDGATLTVQSSSVASAGLAYGHAKFRTAVAAGAFQRDYAKELEAAGWATRLFVLDVTPPEIAPRRSRICIVEGAKGALSLRAHVDAWTAAPTRGAIFWRTAPAPPLLRAVEGAC